MSAFSRSYLRIHRLQAAADPYLTYDFFILNTFLLPLVI